MELYHYSTTRLEGVEKDVLTLLTFYFPRPLQKPLLHHGLIIIEASRPHSLGFLWTSDRPDAETST